MLLRSLYESLPYLYLVVGGLSGLLIDSNLVLIASLLMMTAGALSLVSRHTAREQDDSAGLEQVSAELEPGVRPVVQEKRRGGDRRRSPATSFPLTDFNGAVVTHDRRMGDRRQNFTTGFA